MSAAGRALAVAAAAAAVDRRRLGGALKTGERPGPSHARCAVLCVRAFAPPISCSLQRSRRVFSLASPTFRRPINRSLSVCWRATSRPPVEHPTVEAAATAHFAVCFDLSLPTGAPTLVLSSCSSPLSHLQPVFISLTSTEATYLQLLRFTLPPSCRL